MPSGTRPTKLNIASRRSKIVLGEEKMYNTVKFFQRFLFLLIQNYITKDFRKVLPCIEPIEKGREILSDNFDSFYHVRKPYLLPVPTRGE